MLEIEHSQQSNSIEDLVLDDLIQNKIVEEHDLERARMVANTQDSSIVLRLNQLGLISDTQMLDVFHRITRLSIATRTEFESQQTADNMPLDPAFMHQTRCLMFENSGPLYVVDPTDIRIGPGVEFAIGQLPKTVQLISAADWSNTYQLHFATDLETSTKLGDDAFSADTALIQDQDRDAPIVRLVNNWINKAADQNASDIHFESKRNFLDVQYRLDGRLISVAKHPIADAQSIIARIKVLADLDLGERHKSQDGRATVVVRGRKLDVRVSIVPTIEGESAVIRILDRSKALLSLDTLGLDPETIQHLTETVNRKHGLFIVSGPTGSGKTTTLYACIQLLKDRGLKILSIEDPVEYQFEHVNQVQVSEKAGRTFAQALRSFLRHDPDVIMVGEIRDSETAKTAVQAALTGHLVLATLHAIDADRVRTRLIDMGVEAFRLDACLTGALTQRLVRQLCSECKQPVQISHAQASHFTQAETPAPTHLYDASGCPHCNGKGYKDRTAISIFATPNDKRSDEHALRKAALRAVARGETTLAEIAGMGE